MLAQHSNSCSRFYHGGAPRQIMERCTGMKILTGSLAAAWRLELRRLCFVLLGGEYGDFGRVSSSTNILGIIIAPVMSILKGVRRIIVSSLSMAMLCCGLVQTFERILCSIEERLLPGLLDVFSPRRFLTSRFRSAVSRFLYRNRRIFRQ